jgi:hypothetical protein
MISKERKLIILLPPKTASTSIEDAFKKSEIKFDNPNKIVDYPTLHLKLSEICETHNIQNPEEYKIIQFTRNPYYRFVSSYYHLIKITPNYKEIIFNGMNFDEFVFHIDKCKSSENFIKEFFGDDSHYYKNLRIKKNWSGVRMFEEQVTYNDLGLKIDYFKTEDLYNNLKIISSLISVEIPPILHLNKNPINVNYNNLLDSELKVIIYKNFISDFEILDYEK